MLRITKLLPLTFEGVGEMKGYDFEMIYVNDFAYVYKISAGGKTCFYETIRRVKVPVCLDFEKRIYSENEFKEVYPKANKFGVDGWNFHNVSKAIERANKLKNESRAKETEAAEENS